VNEIVLVHGAWQGAWCWDRVTPLLEAAGRVVLTPTLTGSGDRAAELSPAITLEHHVDEVVGELVDGDLRDVVLVGHSYSGMVITGAAERAADRLAALVFVDAFYPDHAESAIDQMPPAFQERFRQRTEEGDGWRLPADDALLDIWGLRDSDLRAWVRPRLTDWSLNCFTSPVDAPEMRRAEVPRSYVAAAAENYPAKAAFGPIAAKAEADGCRIHRVDTGHDVMLEAPRELADILLKATG
jgi:pimeloyl-ACP methyl ester carboxylesterase